MKFSRKTLEPLALESTLVLFLPIHYTYIRIIMIESEQMLAAL